MAMQQLDQMPEVEIIIIARGGGSFQDLLPFSDERLVRAAAALTKPVVSAIGHENDSPLLDLVADLRASTPTDAAKRVVPDVVEERKALSQLRDRLAFRVASFIDSQLQLIESITSRPVLKSPYGFIEYQEEQVGQLARRLTEILSFRVDRAESENTQLTARVRSLSPQLTMERGYAVVTGADGKQATSVKKGQQLRIQTAKQEISATTDEVREK